MAEVISRKMGDLVKRLKNGRLGDLSPLFKSHTAVWLSIALTVAAATILTTVTFQRMPSNLAEGMVAVRDIKADRNYIIVDEESSERLKLDAVEAIQPLYDLDVFAVDAIVERIKNAFAVVRSNLGDLPARGVPAEGHQKKVIDAEFEGPEKLEALFAEKIGITPTSAQWKVIVKQRASEKMESAVITLVKKVMAKPIVAERGTLDSLKGKGIVVRRVVAKQEEKYEEYLLDDLTKIVSTDEARKKIQLQDIPGGSLGDRDSDLAAVGIAQMLIEPNCVQNRAETQRRMDTAAEAIEDVQMKVKAGEMIIREGDTYTHRHIKILRGIQKEKLMGTYLFKFLGTAIIIILLLIPFHLMRKSFRRIEVSATDYVLMAVVALAMFSIMRMSFALAPAVRDAFMLMASTQALYYLVPFAGAAMVIRMYLGAEVSFVYAVVLTMTLGSFDEVDIDLALFYMVTSFTAIIAITNVDKRSSIIRAGAVTGTIGAVTVLAQKLTVLAFASATVSAGEILWSMGFAAVGGVGAAIFAMIAAPVIESLSGYTSDIKLLELANLNHPLLRELIVRAPGTYHHSHLVGILAEAAAEAIGANSLLVRVGAYYHDIGKMKKPLYFVENAKSGEDRHEKLSPHMSALIVAAHVKDGMEMARTAVIPRVISDMIPEHHGTRLISFFYEKAKALGDPHSQKVDQKEFSYPGPKPQTRESAILMLSDVTEASVRSLKEKSSTRIQQTVERVMNDIFAESQLDECELTLKDLHEIARAFVRILLGIYHQRIEYPKGSDEEHDRVDISISEGETQGEAGTSELAQAGPGESSKPKTSSVSIR